MPAIWTDSQIVSNLLRSGTSWSGSNDASYPNVYYSFPTTAPAWSFSTGEGAGFRAFNPSQIAAAKLAIGLWDDLTSINFIDATGTGKTAQITFQNSNIDPTDYAHAYYPGNPSFGSGSVWLNQDYNTANNSGTNNLDTPTIGKWGFMTYLHELGHALGLSHPGVYNGGSPTYGVDALYTKDTIEFSVMSYFTADNTGADWVATDGHYYYAQTPMIDDVLAIQARYGIDTTTRTGDTTYGFHSTADRSVFDFTVNANPILTIWDAAGVDTLDLSGFTTASRIDLHAGASSDCDGMTGNIWIANSCVIENALGGIGDDNITGNDAANNLNGGGGNDTLTGGNGNDTLVGGAGNDTAVFAGNISLYTFTFDAATGTFTVSGGSDGMDSVTGVESFKFADGTKTAAQIQALASTGTPPSTVTASITPVSTSLAEGNSGLTDFAFTVTLSAASASSETIHYTVAGTGINAANISDFSGLLSGDIVFAAGTTTQVIHVSVAGDLIVELNETFGVTLSAPSSGIVLGTAVATATILNDDTATSPPVGTANADNLVGTAGNDTINGLAGNDRIDGAGGNDVIRGGSGVDIVTGGSGADTFVFAKGDIAAATTSAATNAQARDVITDFTQGVDHIDLSGFDANSKTAAIDHFKFVGAFTSQSFGALPASEFGKGLAAIGSIKYHYEDIGGVQHTIVDLNTASGNTTAEYQIDLVGGHYVLTASDFIL